jgi:RimJ/RimL family protein N-acetyltransferase
MQLSAHILGDHFVRLEPIEPRHKAGIRRACEADRSIWKELYPTSWIGEAFEPSWTDLLARNAAGQWISFAVFSTGAAVGMTSLLAPDPANASVEIGATYYQPDARGGPVNPAAKRLLLAHARSTRSTCGPGPRS